MRIRADKKSLQIDTLYNIEQMFGFLGGFLLATHIKQLQLSYTDTCLL